MIKRQKLQDYHIAAASVSSCLQSSSLRLFTHSFIKPHFSCCKPPPLRRRGLFLFFLLLLVFCGRLMRPKDTNCSRRIVSNEFACDSIIIWILRLNECHCSFQSHQRTSGFFFLSLSPFFFFPCLPPTSRGSGPASCNSVANECRNIDKEQTQFIHLYLTGFRGLSLSRRRINFQSLEPLFSSGLPVCLAAALLYPWSPGRWLSRIAAVLWSWEIIRMMITICVQKCHYGFIPLSTLGCILCWKVLNK